MYLCKAMRNIKCFYLLSFMQYMEKDPDQILPIEENEGIGISLYKAKEFVL